jgi:hypothetical protein
VDNGGASGEIYVKPDLGQGSRWSHFIWVQKRPNKVQPFKRKSMGNYFLAGALHFSQTLPALAAFTQQGWLHFSPFLSALSQQPPALNFADSLVVVAGLTSGEGEAAKATEAQTRAITNREAICFMVVKKF